MAKQQRTEVAPPLQTDKQLLDFASVVQSNFSDLYEDAHSHTPRTTVPSAEEGSIGDQIPVFVSPDWYLYIKVDAVTWKRTAALV